MELGSALAGFISHKLAKKACPASLIYPPLDGRERKFTVGGASFLSAHPADTGCSAILFLCATIGDPTKLPTRSKPIAAKACPASCPQKPAPSARLVKRVRKLQPALLQWCQLKPRCPSLLQKLSKPYQADDDMPHLDSASQDKLASLQQARRACLVPSKPQPRPPASQGAPPVRRVLRHGAP